MKQRSVDQIECLRLKAIEFERYGQYEPAATLWRSILQMSDRDPGALGGLGRASVAIGEHDVALEYFHRATLYSPQNRAVHDEYVMQLMRLCNWRAAANAYRRGQPQWAMSQLDGTQEWNGAPLNGKIVSIKNNGYGDTLQFVRFARWLQDCGARVIIHCRASLKTLIAASVTVDSVITPDEPEPKADFVFRSHITHVLLDRLDREVSDSIPYLQPSIKIRKDWQRRIQSTGANTIRIGICWRGSPLWSGNPHRYRSMELTELRLLADASALTLYSLQLDGAADLANFAWSDKVVDLASGFRDFEDAAAATLCLDAVVTVDTSIAHLAGALGKRCIVMLPRYADWRWHSGASAYPWYRTVELVRQVSAGNWSDVVLSVRTRLCSIAQDRGLSTADSSASDDAVMERQS